MTATTSSRLVCRGSIKCKNELTLGEVMKQPCGYTGGHFDHALHIAANYLGWRRRGDQILCPVHADGCLEAREL